MATRLLDVRRPFLALLLGLIATVSAASPEEQARAVIDQFNAAMKAKDADAVSRLLSNDCVIIMTEPSAGTKAARFFTRESFLKLLRDRYAQTTGTTYDETVHSVSPSELGDVFVAADSDERARIGQRVEWIRSHVYLVMRPVGEHMMIRLVVAELAFYFPDVPREPEKESEKS